MMPEMKIILKYLLTLEGRVVATITVIVVLALIRFLLRLFASAKVKDIQQRMMLRQTANHVVWILGLILIVWLWYAVFENLFTIISVVAVAFVILFREMLNNLLSNLVILWRGLFTVGERISIDGYIGKVTMIGPMYITLAETGDAENHYEPTGKIVKIPNATCLTKSVTNYSRGLPAVWAEVPIKITMTSDWKRAKAILLEIGARVTYVFDDREMKEIESANEETVFPNHEPSVFVGVEDGKIILRLRYLCHLATKRETEEGIWEEILDRFGAEPDIDLVSS